MVKKRFRKFNIILTGEAVEKMEEARDFVLEVKLPELRKKIESESDPDEIADLEKRKKELLRFVLRQNQMIHYSEIIIPTPIKFYEFHDPYYALIKAKTKRLARITYISYVADDYDNKLRDEIKEVSRDYALARFSRGVGEGNKQPSIKEVLEEFQRDENSVLIIDPALV
ncbi:MULTISPECIES: hypothetical protein [Bacillales]|uniref:hypothetical protein n=1 Tax=Bacillales TaxID=1385 RepID=UPI00036F89CB|nr:MULTISPECIES: hypothetical protein [Bacillales]